MQKHKNTPNFHVGINQKLKSSSFSIHNIQQASFPYKPYPQQIRVISCVSEAIQHRQNALIQSPTGTGKTLCLLTGALSQLRRLKNTKIKIFYLTRTHTQIGQVIEQLKKTPYTLKTNVIASRDHLCVNPNLSQLKGRVLQKACNDVVNSKTCLFKQKQNKISLRNSFQPMVLQQFKQQCKKELTCPFFYSRELTEKTQVTILPFNYFLDWKIFQTFSHLIKNSVIIFDEAHNVDSIAEEGANLQLDCRQLSFAINELKQLQKKFKFQNQSNTKSRQQLGKVCCILQRLRLSIQSSGSRIFCSKGQLEEFMYKSTKTVDPENVSQTVQGLDLVDSMPFIQTLHQATKHFYKKQAVPSNLLNVIGCLEKLCGFFSDGGFQKDFIAKISSQQGQRNFSLRLKCLSPSVSFDKIKQHSPRSIILSSGTLGNLQKWQKYLKVQFHRKLTIQGFITHKQLFAAIVPASQNDYPFQFSYQKKDYQNQHNEVAEQLKRIEQHVPHSNGIVVAFSTYLLMQKVIKHCGRLNKKIFYETKGGDINRVFQQYSKEAKSKGAFLFIVMKGRFSQGINFTDYLCRCLVVVGIPFLPRKQQAIQEKMTYLKQNFSNQEAEDWYRNQTFQAVNQTIGRVIRNKEDFGVILLLDHRYIKKDNFDLLSGWFKKSIRNYSDSKSIYTQIDCFFAGQSWLTIKSQDQVLAEGSMVVKRDESMAKTVKMVKKKKHLKLSYDTDLKNPKQILQQKNEIYEQQPAMNSNQTSYHSPSSQSHNRKQKITTSFLTPPKKASDYHQNSHIPLSSAVSLVLSKINIQNKKKLKGFVSSRYNRMKLSLGDVLLNGQNSNCQGSNSTELKAQRQMLQSKYEEKSKESEYQESELLKRGSITDDKGNKVSDVRKIDPYLEYFMIQ